MRSDRAGDVVVQGLAGGSRRVGTGWRGRGPLPFQRPLQVKRRRISRTSLLQCPKRHKPNPDVCEPRSSSGLVQEQQQRPRWDPSGASDDDDGEDLTLYSQVCRAAGSCFVCDETQTLGLRKASGLQFRTPRTAFPTDKQLPPNGLFQIVGMKIGYPTEPCNRMTAKQQWRHGTMGSAAT